MAKSRKTRGKPTTRNRSSKRRPRTAGEVIEAHLTDQSPFIASGRGLKGAQAKGKQYEKKALEYLEGYFRSFLLPAPWIAFTERGSLRPRLCQPDAISVDMERAALRIFEVKLKHTADSWAQMHKLYVPVVQALFGSAWRCECVEVVKWFDPHVDYPGRFEFISTPTQLFNQPTGIHVYSP